MKKTTITLLFTFAMLVGLAVAPSAQVFRWKAGEDDDTRVRVRTQVAIDRAERAAKISRRTPI